MDLSRYLEDKFLHSMGVPTSAESPKMNLRKNLFLEAKLNN